MRVNFLEILAGVLIVIGIAIGFFSISPEFPMEEQSSLELIQVSDVLEEPVPEPEWMPEEVENQETQTESKLESENFDSTKSDTIIPSSHILPTGEVAYSQLDSATQTVYREILSAIEGYKAEADISILDEKVLSVAYEAMTCDHGELFWTKGYRYTRVKQGGKVVRLRFMPTYTMIEKERDQYRSVVKQVVNQYLEGLPEEASDYEKVKWVYESLIRNVIYNTSAQNNQNILSVFLNGESVCNGIASAAQYLLTLLDVPCMCVYGQYKGEAHAWNLVEIDRENYYLDATWGINSSETLGTCAYQFLNFNDEDIRDTHSITMKFPIPQCMGTAANYYIREGLYFTSYDEEAIGQVFGSSYQNGDTAVSVRCNSEGLYQEIKQRFITEQKVLDYCPGLKRLYYSESPTMRVLTIWW